ncbi:phage terminase large subunit family protein [Escherichia coli]|nr:phage terminase large subunit family protein [Escherichia coli]WQC27641.1 phage terminase large subunit family protein [Escherichia coli]
MGNDQIRTVNLIKSARVGYTKMLLGVVGYFIEHKSRNSLLFQPTDSAAEDFMEVSRGGDDSGCAMSERPFSMAGA